MRSRRQRSRSRSWSWSCSAAIIDVYLQQYLLKVAAEPSFGGLPAILRVPLSQPGFPLGVIFLQFILFAPGGIAGLLSRVRARRHAR